MKIKTGDVKMHIVKRISVPTGDILIVEGGLGQLEMLSLGDYGQDVNVKANFLNLDRPIQKVEHQPLLPLSKKWVITISTQYGCAQNCHFCDVPKVGPGKNATMNDLVGKVVTGLKLHPEVARTERLNIHFARMGEPTLNNSVLEATRYLYYNLDQMRYKVHPVVSTMMPKRNKNLEQFIRQWMWLKNNLYNGNAGLQLSINSTDENERTEMFNGNACSLEQIAKIMTGIIPNGRKITLNFAVGPYIIDPSVLLKYFSPEHYLIKLTPMHKTSACISNSIVTEGDYTTYQPYEKHEENLRNAGYDVLVFIASEEEDLGRITCGNAILSGTLPFDISRT